EVIRQKALEFAALLGVPKSDFKASDSWFSRFKARIGIQNHRIHREAESALIEFLPQFYIFNADECGLFYCMEPNTSLLTSARKGKKKKKSRITVVCMSNAGGTEKIKPLVINKSHIFK
ncbi:5470_t:CDS:2, partial [Racocetra fulgida]